MSSGFIDVSELCDECQEPVFRWVTEDGVRTSHRCGAVATAVQQFFKLFGGERDDA